MNQFSLNKDGSIEQDRVFLVDRLFNLIGNREIYPIDDLKVVANLNENWECSFTVYRETDGVKNLLWDKIQDLSLVKIENKGIFELEAPITDEECTYKQCVGKSICEAETSQSYITLEVNTENDIARESKDDPTFTYYKEFPTVLYRNIKDLTVFDKLKQDSTDNTVEDSTNNTAENNTDNAATNNSAAKFDALSDDQKKEILRRSSLLHRVFSEMPEYLANIDGEKIDKSLKNSTRIPTFSWDNTSVYDICQEIATELQCIFIFDRFSRSFEVRDLKEHCDIDGCRDIKDGICPVCKENGTTQHIHTFGKYSGVEIDTKNLAETIELSGDKDAVKNYFKIEGADDVITNRISNRLIGNGYIWKLGALQKSQMSKELVDALESREAMIEENDYESKYNELWDEWNRLDNKILHYRSGMMPSPETAEKKADYVFHYLFGEDGKIDHAYANNHYQSAERIADSVMNYAKLLSPTNHTIEYIESSLSYTPIKWNNYDVVDKISFKVHIYLEGHYKDNDETKGYADEYTSETITLKVCKGYDITYTEEEGHKGIYTTDYYNYLKHLIDTANAKSDITDEVITFDPATKWDIAPDATFSNGVPLKSTHYSKYCLNRLDSFRKAYEACSAVIAKINSTISSDVSDTITQKTILSGETRAAIGKSYFVVPLQSDLSTYRFRKNVTYTLTVTSSSSYGFETPNIMCVLGTDEEIYPGSSKGLRSYICTKKDAHTFQITIEGDGNAYSHLCIGLGKSADYDNKYLYLFHISAPYTESDETSDAVDILSYLKSDGTIGKNIQEDLLGKYRRYMVLISARTKWLEEQIKDMEEQQASLMKQINEIKDICDMENCIKKYTEENDINRNLWYELCSFKRQDTYKNDNLIGEGLNDADLMKNVEDLIKRAEEEIDSACNITYSATATIGNLLVMPEFERFWNKFALGNYIHMVIDDKVHTMRLVSITYDYSDLSHCPVEFSEIVKKEMSETDKVKNVLSKAAALTTSAKTIARQAESGAEAKLTVNTIKNDALNIANSKIITADSQDFVLDKYGLTGKYTDPISGEVSGQQVRLINNMLCFTDDGWQHTRSALGEITYINPETGEYETRYGLIADSIIGNLLIGEKLILQDNNGSIRIDGNGIMLDGGKISWKNPIKQSAVDDLTNNLKEITDFNNTVKTSLMGSSTTDIGTDYVISPKIGGGYLYIVDGNNSITLNPHAESVSVTLDGNTHTSTNMVEVVSDGNEILSINKSGELSITGDINAVSGKFTGGLLLNGGYLTTNKERKSYDSTKEGLTIDSQGIGGYSSEDQYFSFTKDGKLTASGAEINGAFDIRNIGEGSIQIETSNDTDDYIIFNYLYHKQTPDHKVTQTIQRSTKFSPKEFSIFENIDHIGAGISEYTDNKITLTSDSIQYNYKCYDDEFHTNVSDSYDYSIDFNEHGMKLNAAKITSCGTLFTKDGTVISSDKRLKNDIDNIHDEAVDFIMRLSPKKYKLVNGTSDRYHYGFIAQEVEEVMKDSIGDVGVIVKQEKKHSVAEEAASINLDDENTFYYGLRYEELIAPMVKTIQTLYDEINELKQEVALLKKNNMQ